MQLYAYRNTEASAKRFVPDEGMMIARRRKSVGRANVIQISLEWLRRQEERRKQDAERKERNRLIAARKNSEWAAALAKVKGTIPRTHATEIIAMVCAWHGVEFDDVMGKSRRVPVVKARYDAMAAVWFNCRMEGQKPNFCSMGRLFRRDHTVILHGLRKLAAIPEAGRRALQESGQP